MQTATLQDGKKDGYGFSRVMYWIEAALEYFISILTSGAFLAKLTSAIGISDSMTAVLSAITSLASLSQIVSIYIAHKAPVKRFVWPIMVISQLMLASLYMIPFMNIGGFAMGAIFFIVMLTSKLIASIVSPLKTTWFMNLVPMRERGNYTAILQIISHIGGAAFSFASGMIIDSFSESGNVKGAFATLTVAILVICVLHTLTLLLSREKPPETKEDRKSPLGGVKQLFSNKTYVLLLGLGVIETLGTNIINPFLGTYEVGELGFSMTFISTIGIVFSIASTVFVAFFGRLSKMYQHKTMLAIAYPIMMLAYFLNSFTSPANGSVMFIIYSLVQRLGSAALAVSTTNVLLEVVPRQEQTAALAIKSIVCGVLGFVITLAVSPFIDFMQANGNSIFGINAYAQQILSFLAFIVYLVLIAYYFLFLYKRLGGTENRIHNTEGRGE